MKKDIIIGKLIRRLMLFLLMLLFAPRVSYAFLYDYSYTGRPFNEAFSTPPYTPANFIAIEILADHPITAGNQGVSGRFSFTISDGFITGHSTFPNSDSYIVTLGADGLPVEWYLKFAMTTPAGDQYLMGSERRETYAADYSEIIYADGRIIVGEVRDFLGDWTLTVTPDSGAAVPEPSTSLLLFVGAALMVVICRHRKVESSKA